MNYSRQIRVFFFNLRIVRIKFFSISASRTSSFVVVVVFHFQGCFCDWNLPIEVSKTLFDTYEHLAHLLKHRKYFLLKHVQSFFQQYEICDEIFVRFKFCHRKYGNVFFRFLAKFKKRDINKSSQNKSSVYTMRGEAGPTVKIDHSKNQSFFCFVPIVCVVLNINKAQRASI